jgi:hypothetical protein
MLTLASAALIGEREVGDAVVSEIEQEEVPDGRLPHRPAGTLAFRIVRRPAVVMAVARVNRKIVQLGDDGEGIRDSLVERI